MSFWYLFFNFAAIFTSINEFLPPRLIFIDFLCFLFVLCKFVVLLMLNVLTSLANELLIYLELNKYCHKNDYFKQIGINYEIAQRIIYLELN